MPRSPESQPQPNDFPQGWDRLTHPQRNAWLKKFGQNHDQPPAYNSFLDAARLAPDYQNLLARAGVDPEDVRKAVKEFVVDPSIKGIESVKSSMESKEKAS